MVFQITSLLADCLSSCISIVTRFFNATGMTGIFIANFFIFMVVRFFIKPFIGYQTSTNVKQYAKKNEGKK